MNRKRVIGWLVAGLVLVAAAGAWLALDPGFRAPQRTTASDLPADEFERRVRAYLLDNPEVIVEAMQRLEARRRAAAQDEVRAVLAARADEVFRDVASPVGGNPQGDVTLVEFFDYNCPYCRQVAPAVSEAAAADGQLRIVYKEFPILGPNSVFAAKAALAAHRQERYVAFHQALMQVRGTVNEDAVLAAAAKVGLDIERLRTDMQDAELQAAIDRNLALAAALRINGTPGFVIGDETLRGAAELKTLQALIRKAREAR
jgi:protein-disulfide isomerase